MKLIVGLGNPGDRYIKTRHNVGFLAIDVAIQLMGAHKAGNQWKAQIFEGECWGEKIYLMKPQTYMNLSGNSVKGFFSYFKLECEELIVIHDDLDLLPNQVKLKKGGGSGGHQGIRSIDQALGDQNYHRVRIGIGRPNPLQVERMGKSEAVSEYVLSNFSKSELLELEDFLDKIWKQNLPQYLIKEGRIHGI